MASGNCVKGKGTAQPVKTGRALRDTAPALLALLLILSFMATTCGGTAGEADPPPQVEGPALVMFYTDN